MTITDRDIWRTARAMIEVHCNDAPIQAAMKADDRLREGDIEGQLVWKRVLAAINEIRRSVPVEGERLN